MELVGTHLRIRMDDFDIGFNRNAYHGQVWRIEMRTPDPIFITNYKERTVMMSHTPSPNDYSWLNSILLDLKNDRLGWSDGLSLIVGRFETERQHQAKLEARLNEYRGQEQLLFEKEQQVAKLEAEVKELRSKLEAQYDHNRDLNNQLAQAEARVRELEAKWEGTTAIIQKGEMTPENYAGYRMLQQQLAQLQEEKAELDKTHQGVCASYLKRIAQLQLELGQLKDALRYLYYDRVEIVIPGSKISEACSQSAKELVEGALSAQTPPLYSAVVELVNGLEAMLHQNHHTVEEEKWRIEKSLATLKNLMGRTS